MPDRYVASKSVMKSIPCDGPVDAQLARGKLEEEMKAKGLQPDVEVDSVKKPRPKPRAKRGSPKRALGRDRRSARD